MTILSFSPALAHSPWIVMWMFLGFGAVLLLVLSVLAAVFWHSLRSASICVNLVAVALFLYGGRLMLNTPDTPSLRVQMLAALLYAGIQFAFISLLRARREAREARTRAAMPPLPPVPPEHPQA